MGDNYKIMIVEDEGVIAMNLRRKLEMMGFTVTSVVDNCTDALKQAADTRPDLVMMDIIIQGDADGIETAERLRDQQDVPVVFLTAHSDESTIERAKSALPYGYLVKPFEERELKTTIEMALFRHESQAIQRLQHQALASATVGIVIADAGERQWPIVMCNPAVASITGYDVSELEGRDLFTLCNAESIEELQEIKQGLIEGMPGRLTTTCHRKDGEKYVAEASFSSVRDEAGHITHHLAVVLDVTERVNAERLANRTQRLEAIGTLVGGVAHDLNNALSPILMGAQLLQMKYPDATDSIKVFEASATRGANMVRQLLTFAKGAEGERIAIQPAHLINEMVQIMGSTFPKNIDIQRDTPRDLPSVMGDATQLHQILLNLCVNARDAMPKGGTLSITASSTTVDELMAKDVPNASPGKYVQITVSDTGVGIPEDVLDRIFEPFFSTKPQDQGTGLGLSTVIGIVKGHDGFVQVDSTVGRGSTFTIYLPINESEVDVASLSETTEVFRGDGELVLLVDDEKAVRQIGREVLHRLNFKPITASDGLDGLLQVTEHREAIRAAIVDLHMPTMEGKTFIQGVRRLLPDLPVIVASGRMDDGDREDLESFDIQMFLDKPFTEAQLSEALRRAINGETTNGQNPDH